jgi:hypothetical protein
MDNVKPSTWAMLGGGILLLISSFLDWFKIGGGGFSVSSNAWDRGLLGFFLLLISGVAIAVAVIDAFAPQIQLPDSIIGFTPVQAAMALGTAALVLSFSLLFAFKGFQIGTILAVLSSAAIVVGGHLDNKPAEAEPPRTI